MAETVRGVSALQNELEKAKESLKDVDENIKKLTGRDPTIQRTPQRRVALGNPDRGGRTAVAESRLFSLARRGIIQEDTSPGKRRSQQGGAFARLGPLPSRSRRGGRGRDSGDEDELPNKPALQSSVIATSREERSRQNSIEEQSRDRKGQARNRRMFGLLLGTLQKFKDDAAVSKEKEEQRQKIEKKLEEKFKQEKEEIIKERRQLFLERRQKQYRIRLLEQKMEMVQNHDDWERETRKLENFIITKAKPCLFYLPKILTEDSEAKLDETREAITGMIEMRRKKMEEEIADMMNQVQDEGMEEGDEHGDIGEEIDGESEDERTDDKENEERERHLRMKRERDEHLAEKDDLDEEREKRDREREQRDRDRQLRDRSGEGRKGREYRERSKERSKDERKRDKEREHSDGRKDRERDRQRDKDHRRIRNRSDRSRSRDRERNRSGKNRSDRKRDHSEERKFRGHGNKSKRRSRGEGKAEKREKMWEPMEDEVEEEFVGSKESEKVSIASKMLEMAGMAEAVKEAKAAGEARGDIIVESVAGEAINLEDIPRPAENGSALMQGNDGSEGANEATGDNKDKFEVVQP